MPVKPYFTQFKGHDQTLIGEEWTILTHPEGPIYYRSDRKHGNVKFKLVTEENVEDSEIRRKIDEVIDNLLALEDGTNSHLHGNDIFLKQSKSEDKEEWFYYIANHENRSIFWLHFCDCRDLTNALGGVHSNQPSTAMTHMRT